MTGRPAAAGPRVVALGGGHGLAASLAALRQVTDELTAVVTVADDGGSSGRLRAEYPALLPPGDLRMALAALAGDDDDGRLWSEVLQHRFAGDGAAGRARRSATCCWPALHRTCSATRSPALDEAGRLLGARGRVLPMSLEPLDIVAEVARARTDADRRPRGARPGRGRRHHAAGSSASAWSRPTRGLPGGGRRHPGGRPGRPRSGLVVHQRAAAPAGARAARGAARAAGPTVLVLNLAAAAGGDRRLLAAGSTSRCSRRTRPDLRVDVVLADRRHRRAIREALARSGARTLGAELVLAPVAVDDGIAAARPGAAGRRLPRGAVGACRRAGQTARHARHDRTTSARSSSTGGHRAWR